MHLRTCKTWWVIETVNDRGQRRNGDAKLSSFESTEKYLIWAWATTARSELASGPLVRRPCQGRLCPECRGTKVDTKYEICSNDECAILSVLNATIFSHLIRKTVDEIEEMVTFGLR